MPEELVEVPRRAKLDLRTRQERLDADVHLKAALHAVQDHAADDLVVLDLLRDLLPHTQAVRLALGEDALAVVVLARLDVDVDLVADADRERAFAVFELVGADAAFRLLANVDEDRVAHDLEHAALGDRALGDGGALTLVGFKERDEFGKLVAAGFDICENLIHAVSKRLGQPYRPRSSRRRESAGTRTGCGKTAELRAKTHALLDSWAGPMRDAEPTRPILLCQLD